MPESQAAFYFYNFARILKAVHALDIAHRDIKAENILINEDINEVGVIDFGLSAQCPEGAMLKTACGSPHYCAPEILAKEKYDGKKSDVWSCGVLLFFMLCGSLWKLGHLPYFDEHAADLYSKIIFEDLVMPTHLHPEAVDLLRKLLDRNPSSRPSLNDVLDHPWFSVRKVFSKDFDDLEWEVENNLARSEALGSIISTVLVDFNKQASQEAQDLFGVSNEDDIREQLATNPDSKLKP